MAIPKEEPHKSQFIKWFSELNRNSGNVAGGKGANLAEIYNLKIPVPPGFVVTAQAYNKFIQDAGIKEKINQLLEQIDYEDTKQLNETTQNIRKLITDSEFPKKIEEEILEAYEDLGAANIDMKKGAAVDILHSSAEPIFVAVRSSATAEDLAGASFAGQQDTFLNVKGNQELLDHVKKAFASLYTSRATYYRNKKGFEHSKVSIAIIVQKMIDADKSGVVFTKDPAFKSDNTIVEAVWGLGEGIVSGRITPDRYIVNPQEEIEDKKVATKKIAITRDSSGAKSIVKLRPERAQAQVLKDHEVRKLTEYGLKLEKHYNAPQDIEFAIESDEIYIVQTRPITTIETRAEKDHGKEIKGDVVLTGLGASPGIASGKIRIIEDLEDLHKIKQGDILVTDMTNPDMVVAMQRSAAIVTDEGGMTAHAAIVSREMGIPAVVGTDEATTKLKEAEIITVDGFTGKIYKGKVSEDVQKEVLPVTSQTKTKMKVIVDLPTFAKRAAKSGIREVGLTRIEGIIAEAGKHPQAFLKKGEIKDYENVIFEGVEGIAKHFDELWIRTSDIRTDEFENLEGAPKEPEANPMLGYHGIRYSLENPEILKAELNALKRISEEGKTIGLLLPQIISVEEVQKVKQHLKEIEFLKARVGVMVETPAAVQIIKDLCEEKIDFISFGTNDLTQYILAVDRGNSEVQDIYDEMHPAVLKQLEYVIRVCKRYNVETSICGQAGSKKPMVKYLVEREIDSISVNADMAKEISDYIAEIEKQIAEKKGSLERQYQAEEKTEETKTLPEDVTVSEEKEVDDSELTDTHEGGTQFSDEQGGPQPPEPEISQQEFEKGLIEDKRAETTFTEPVPEPEPTEPPVFSENPKEDIKQDIEEEVAEEFPEVRGAQPEEETEEENVETNTLPEDESVNELSEQSSEDSVTNRVGGEGVGGGVSELASEPEPLEQEAIKEPASEFEEGDRGLIEDKSGEVAMVETPTEQEPEITEQEVEPVQEDSTPQQTPDESLITKDSGEDLEPQVPTPTEVEPPKDPDTPTEDEIEYNQEENKKKDKEEVLDIF